MDSPKLHEEDIEHELEKLRELFNANLIFKEEYDRRSSDLLSRKNGQDLKPAQIASPSKTAKKKLPKDPHCSAPEHFEVLEDFNCMLNQSAIGRNNNKFFVVQLLTDGTKYFEFARWGRVGEKGQNKLTPFSDRASAEQAFKRRFKDKTANNWDARQTFIPMAGKYTLIEIDYDDEPVSLILPEALRLKLQQFGDVKLYDKIMMNLDFDVKKLPAAKLNARQIEMARETLNQLKSQDLSNTQRSELCSRYYTVIPHCFGMRRPPLITDVEPHVKKMNVLEHIKDIMTLLKSPQNESSVNQIEALYGKISAELKEESFSSSGAEISQNLITGNFNPLPTGPQESLGLSLPPLSGGFTTAPSPIETKPWLLLTTPTQASSGVDPRCNLTGVQVYDDFNTTLWYQDGFGMASTKLYTIQVLTDGSKYHVFSRWGRIGQEGNDMTSTCDNANDAVNEFKMKFKAKTGNEWDERKNFVAKQGKYSMLELNNSNIESLTNMMEVASISTLPSSSPLQPLQQQVKTAPSNVSSSSKQKVDSECKLRDVQIHEDYACILNQTNIAANTNRFYILQMLTNNANKFWVFSRWGRVGESGQNALRECDTLNVAVADFKKKFKEKTGNDWASRKSFQAVPEKYVLLEMEFGDDAPAPTIQPQKSSFTFGSAPTPILTQPPPTQGGFTYRPLPNQQQQLPSFSFDGSQTTSPGSPLVNNDNTFGNFGPLSSTSAPPPLFGNQFVENVKFNSFSFGDFGSRKTPTFNANNEMELKCLIVGGAAVGKSTFVTRHKTGEFGREYNATVGMQQTKLPWYTNRGTITFNMVEVGGQHPLDNIDEAYLNADCAIIMFDVTSRTTYKDVPLYHKDVLRVCTDIPIVLVGNKVDVKERQVRPQDITFHRKKNLQYYDISAKSNYNFEKPFLYLIRKMLNDPNVSLVPSPALLMPEISLKDNKVPLPEDDDDLDDFKPKVIPTQPIQSSIKKFKVLLVGDPVGKSCFVKKLLSQQFETKYKPTMGVEVWTFKTETKTGEEIVFDVWDTAGQEKFGGLRDGYYIMGSAALIFYSVASLSSAKNLTNWHRDVTRVCENVPMVICGTQADLPEEEHLVTVDNIPSSLKDRYTVMEVSAKSNLNIYEPFIELARKLLHDPELEFKEKFPLPVLKFAGKPAEQKDDEEKDEEESSSSEVPVSQQFNQLNLGGSPISTSNTTGTPFNSASFAVQPPSLVNTGSPFSTTAAPSPMFGGATPPFLASAPSTFTLPGSGGTFKFPSNSVPVQYNNTTQSTGGFHTFPSTFGQSTGAPVTPLFGQSNTTSGITLPSIPVPLRPQPVLQSGTVAPMTLPCPPPSSQQDKFTSALDFLEEVKKVFADRPIVYSNFLDIMKDFKSQSIDTIAVIARVKQLFVDHPKLILGFNAFLPPGYRMEEPQVDDANQVTNTTTKVGTSSSVGQQPASNLSLDDARGYVTKVKNRFLNNPQIYKAFLETLHNYHSQATPVLKVLEQITTLFAGHDDLLDQFKVFLPEMKPSAQVAKQAKKREFRRVAEKLKSKNGHELRPYQLDGLNWLLYGWANHRGSILADEMGLGKTIQTIAFLNHLVTVEENSGPFLIVVPLATMFSWKREFETWTDMNVVVYQGDKSARKLMRETEFFIQGTNKIAFNVLLMSYEFLIVDQDELAKIDWEVLVIDEAHRIKNSESKIANVLRECKAGHRLMLTGTPIQNNTEQIWSLLNFVDPIKFPSKEEFLAQFGILEDVSQIQQLHSLMAPYLMRRLKSDVERELNSSPQPVNFTFGGANRQPSMFGQQASSSNFTFGGANQQPSTFGQQASSSNFTFGGANQQPSMFGQQASSSNFTFGGANQQPSTFGQQASSSNFTFGGPNQQPSSFVQQFSTLPGSTLNLTSVAIPTFKVLVVGEGGVGKTCFVDGLLKKTFATKYVATLGARVNTVNKTFTNGRQIVFNMWDTAGQEKFRGLHDGYYISADAAIVCYSVESKITAEQVAKWYGDVRRVCENIPIVVVALKKDLDPAFSIPSIPSLEKTLEEVLGHFEVSTKAQDNMNEPLLALAKALLPEPNLAFI